jgi:hypothetical protein
LEEIEAKAKREREQEQRLEELKTMARYHS